MLPQPWTSLGTFRANSNFAGVGCYVMVRFLRLGPSEGLGFRVEPFKYPLGRYSLDLNPLENPKP